MSFRCKFGVALAALALFGATAIPGALSPAAAQQGPAVAHHVQTPATPRPTVSAAYYVEFRAAEVGVYGHSYIAYGRLGPRGRPATTQYADFHPEGGTLGLAVGHVLPVAADMTPEKETLTLPITTAFVRKISAAEYKKVLETIKVAHENNRVWSALAYNCNSFVGDVAAAIGMKTPPSILFATAYIPTLRDLNDVPAEIATAAKPARVRRSETTAPTLTRVHQTVPARQRNSTPAAAEPTPPAPATIESSVY